MGGVTLLASAALAQQAVPPSAAPALIEKRFEKPLIPKSVLEPVVPETPEQAPPPNADQIIFTLSGVVIEGATVFSEKDFLPFYEDLLGKDNVSLADIYRVAEKITALYGNAGYALSRAVVPAQRIHEGIVHLQIIEGFIDKVIIEGNVGANAELIQAYGDKIPLSRPLKADVLERYLLLINDLPGIKVQSVLNPSPANHGASNLFLAAEWRPVGASASFDNHGTRTTGPLQETIGLTANSMFGLGERTDLRYIIAGASELNYLDFSHQQQIGHEGTKLTFTAGRSRSTPGYNLRYLEIKSRSDNFGLDITHPFIRTRAQTLAGKAAFALKDSSSRQFGLLSSEDRIRTLSLGGSYDFADQFGGSNLLTIAFVNGLNIMAATEPGRSLMSRQLGRSNFFKSTGEVVRNQPLWDHFALSLGGTWQWSAHNLLAGEEFGFGGAQYGRAYDSSEITGDHGIAAKAELQYTVDAPDWYFKYIQPYVFYDIGRVWQKTPLPAERPTDSAASTGFGLRAELTGGLAGSLEFTKPLTHNVAARTPDDARGTRLFFSLNGNF